MKFSSLTFRQLDRKFFLLADVKASTLLLMQEGVEGAQALLYCYINPDALITFDILGYEKNGQRTLFSDGEPRKVYIDFIYECRCEEVRDKSLSSLPQVAEAQKFYENATVLELRKITEIDSARDAFAPDVLAVTVISGQKAYNTKARIKGVSDSGELLCENLCAFPLLGASDEIRVSFTQSEGAVVAYCVIEQ